MAVTLIITLCLLGAVLFIPVRMYQAARDLGFSRERRMKIALATFFIFAAWFGLVLWGSLSGFFTTPVFRIFGIPFTHVNYLVLGPVLIGSLLIAFSRTTQALLDTFEPYRVILIETARIIGGSFLVRLFSGDLPGIFALPAGVGDLLIGLTAPVMALLYRKYGARVRTAAIVWNILGIAELAMSFTLGYLTFALRVFPVEISGGGLPTTFPLVLIPGFGVPLMILVHIVALRLLFRARRREAA